jgi:hypothetical protein
MPLVTDDENGTGVFRAQHPMDRSGKRSQSSLFRSVPRDGGLAGGLNRKGGTVASQPGSSWGAAVERLMEGIRSSGQSDTKQLRYVLSQDLIPLLLPQHQFERQGERPINSHSSGKSAEYRGRREECARRRCHRQTDDVSFASILSKKRKATDLLPLSSAM